MLQPGGGTGRKEAGEVSGNPGTGGEGAGGRCCRGGVLYQQQWQGWRIEQFEGLCI